MEKKNICKYCKNYAYTTYRDSSWVEHKLCLKHINYIKILKQSKKEGVK
jgi:hypothetical protein